jgi:hypothetical protein
MLSKATIYHPLKIEFYLSTKLRTGSFGFAQDRGLLSI